MYLKTLNDEKKENILQDCRKPRVIKIGRESLEGAKTAGKFFDGSYQQLFEITTELAVVEAEVPGTTVGRRN